jgi:hypothetical protein
MGVDQLDLLVLRQRMGNGTRRLEQRRPGAEWARRCESGEEARRALEQGRQTCRELERGLDVGGARIPAPDDVR